MHSTAVTGIASRRNRAVWLREAGILAGYGLIAILATYPVAWGFFSAIPGYGQDDYQSLWNFWWVKKAVLDDGTSPFFTRMLFYPEGANLSFHTLSFYNTLILGVPLQGFLGLVGTYNLAYLSTFPLTAYGTYRLTLRVTGGDLPSSLAAGLILAFSPFHFSHVQHLTVTSVQFLPFYVLTLLGLRDRPSGARGVLAGVVFTLLAMSSWHYGVFALYFTLFFSFWFAVERDKPMRKGPQIAALCVAGLMAALLLSPFAAPMMQAAFSGDFGKLSGGAKGASADLLAFFIPSPFHPWTRGWNALQSLYRTFSASLEEGTVALGYVGLILAAAGAVRAWRKGARFWAAAAIAFCLLALGPDLQVGGSERLDFTRLPYNWFVQKVPLLNAARDPGRFVSVALLCLAVLAGLGLRELARGRRRRVKWSAAGLASVLILFEFWAAPLPVREVRVSSVYRKIARDEGRFAILEVPVRGWTEGEAYMFAQIHHGRPITGGTISHVNRSALRFIEQEPFLRMLSEPERLAGPAPVMSTEGLSKVGIRYVVLHRDAPAWAKPDGQRGAKNLRAVEAFLDRNLRRLADSTERVRLYRVGGPRGTLPEMPNAGH